MGNFKQNWMMQLEFCGPLTTTDYLRRSGSAALMAAQGTGARFSIDTTSEGEAGLI